MYLGSTVLQLGSICSNRKVIFHKFKFLCLYCCLQRIAEMLVVLLLWSSRCAQNDILFISTLPSGRARLITCSPHPLKYLDKSFDDFREIRISTTYRGWTYSTHNLIYYTGIVDATKYPEDLQPSLAVLFCLSNILLKNHVYQNLWNIIRMYH